jgi:chromosome segregation ATPase
VENVAEIEVEEDIISLLSNQSEEVDDEVVEEVYSGELPDDPEQLKQMLVDAQNRVGKRNHTLKKRTDANHRIQDELKAVQEQLQDLKNAGNQPAPNVEAQNQERKEALGKWKDSVAEKPETAIDYADMQMTQMQDKVVDLVSSMQSKFDEQIAELKGDMNPEKVKNREKIDQLRNNPQFASMDDDTLLAIITATSGIKPRGTIGGRKPEQKSTPEKALEDARARAKKHFADGL